MMPSEVLQFQVLYRKFLGSIIDLELLAAQGDVTKLLGQFAGFLAFFSGMLAFGGMMFDTRHMDPQQATSALWSMEHFFISTTMLVVGVFAVLSWDSTFPDKRDVLVLGPLPVRARTLFLAKAAALGAALGLTVVSLNIFSGLIWPLHFASGGFWGVPRAFAALWISVAGAGAFVFTLVLAAQGLMAQILPRPIFVRLSPLVQIAAFCTFIGTYFLEPSVSSPSAMRDQEPMLAWVPSYWFLAAFQRMNGGPRFALAGRAWSSVAILAALATITYLLSYVRTLRKIVEQPDLAPAARGLSRLPPFGNALQTAIVRFSIRTIARSRQHRVVLAFFLAIGFAILILLLHAPAGHNELAQAEAALLFTNYVVLITTIVGIRAVFTMPIALGANWIFRVTAAGTPDDYRAAIRRPLFVLGIAPVWIASACAFFTLWPWRRAAEHLAILAFAGAIVAYLCLYRFQKIPFTCSFLPGKSKIHMAIMGGPMMLLLVISEAVRTEARALDQTSRVFALLTSMAIATGVIRWFVIRGEEAEVRFEETEAPAVLTLGIQAR